MPTYVFIAAYLSQVEKIVSSLEVTLDRLSETLSHPLTASRHNEISRLESLLRQNSEEEISLGASIGGFGVEEKKNKDRK